MKWGRITLAAVVGVALASTAYAAYQLFAGRVTNVTATAAPTEKARLVRLAYTDNGLFVKPYVLLYTDGSGATGGQLNVYVRRSFDDGTTWDGPILLSKDASGNPTGGQTINVLSQDYLAENDKASIFAPSSYSGSAPRNILVSWTSTYCPDLTSGTYPNALQKIATALTPPRPYKCLWTARSTDAGTTWTAEQLSDASMDADNDVVAGSQNNNAFAIAWQADPMGLQPGEGEGPGDGGSGAHATGGTNIWYARAASLSGANPLLRNNVVQLTDNVAIPPVGDGPPTGPAATRPTLQMSGSTAAIVYEETKGGGGKNVHFHSFAYNNPIINSDGSIVNDPLMNARRPRVVLQGDSSAGSSPLRTLVFYRKSSVIEPGAPADIVLHRGLKDTVADPASTGFRAADLEPYASATNMSDPGALLPGDNALAHRGFMRGSFIAFGYSYATDMVAADPDQTNPPTQTNNFYVRTSNDSGASWSAPVQVSNFEVNDSGLPSISVAEPRIVPTSGTLTNPLTNVPDPGDTQNTNVFYVAYGSYVNTPGKPDYRIFVTRTTNGGASYELAGSMPGSIGQSESQLRVLPDGSSAATLWMQEMAPTAARDVMFTQVTSAYVPDSSSNDSSNNRCFIATAAYGSPMAQDVKVLRAFRDQYLLTNEPGRLFVELYYAVSPPVANSIRSHDTLRAIVRTGLTPLVEMARMLPTASPVTTSQGSAGSAILNPGPGAIQ